MEKIVQNLLKPKLTRSQSFHLSTKLKAFPKSSGEKNWPTEWVKIHFKSYPRFPQIYLSKKITDLNFSLPKAIIRRQSQRDLLGKELKLKELSQILYYSTGITKNGENWDDSKRSYPSAGARYPLEVYLVIFKVNRIKPGIYHYNLKEHSLELLQQGNFEKDIIQATSESWIRNVSTVVLISAVFGRTQIKYGDRGYRYPFIEAGHIGQNIYLISTALKLKCCAIGGFIDDKLNKLLDIDGLEEGVIYILATGR